MEQHKRTHLVNDLMDEANLMMSVLEKAMEGKRLEARTAVLHETPSPQGAFSLEDEHNAWEKIHLALSDIQTALDHIAQAEQQRIER